MATAKDNIFKSIISRRKSIRASPHAQDLFSFYIVVVVVFVCSAERNDEGQNQKFRQKKCSVEILFLPMDLEKPKTSTIISGLRDSLIDEEDLTIINDLVKDCSEIRFHTFEILDIYGRKVVKKLLNNEEVTIEAGKVFHQQLIYQAMALVRDPNRGRKLTIFLERRRPNILMALRGEVTTASFSALIFSTSWLSKWRHLSEKRL